MSEDLESAALKEAAQAEIEFLGELRRNSFDQHVQTFRWLTASLLAINGGAAIAVLNSDHVAPVWKVGAGAFFVSGILSALVVGVLAQRAVMKILPLLQEQLGYWISVASDGLRDEATEQSFVDKIKPSLRLSILTQTAGWLSAIFFLAGLTVVSWGLLSEKKSFENGKYSVVGRESCRRGNELCDR